MFDLIEKLRRKSERTKKLIAFSASLFIAGGIFVVWLSVIFPDFRHDQKREDAVAKLEPSPLETFGDAFKSGVSSIGNEFSKLKDSVTTMTANAVYYNASTSAPAEFPNTIQTDFEATSTTDISTSTPDF